MEEFVISNKNGWNLSLRRVRPDGERRGRPALLIPGYGMNSFIFGFHPTGPSLMEHLASRGIDTFTIDLRGMGKSERIGGNPSYGLAELCIADVGAGIQAVLDRTGADKVDLIGCSLGAALSFGHLACVPDAKVGSLVSLAGVVTWKKVHPLVRAAFYSKELAGRVPFKNTRQTARFLLPMLAKLTPGLLSIYLNPQSTDLSRADEMVQTVEDPVPQINREISEWIARRDLLIRDVNVSAALAQMTYPYLCVVAEGDGVVPKETARAPYDEIGSLTKELCMVGGPGDPIAHGDLFLCKDAQSRVYEPVADFLLRAHAEDERPAS